MSSSRQAISLRTSLLGIDLSSPLTAAHGAYQRLMQKECRGSEFTGWVHYPERQGFAECERISAWVAEKKQRVGYDCVVVVGIGGSYLGTRACASLLQEEFSHRHLPIYYLGQHLSGSVYEDMLAMLEHRRPMVAVVSKSGTTTEPAVAFRLILDQLRKKHADVDQRVVAITDQKKGALKALAQNHGWDQFVIPDDVGGRFSVLTPVGMVPLALAGFDILSLQKGAHQSFAESGRVATEYAAARFACWNHGKTVEILSYPDPKLMFFIEWWKQLFGESEGKEGKGIFPAGLQMTADLHSLGQYAQEGSRHLFETFLHCRGRGSNLTVPQWGSNADELAYLEGRRIDEINMAAMQATMLAHFDGGMPCLEIEVADFSATSVGGLIAFFEMACAVSSDLMGVNAFDQPGVEAYKKNLFAMMEKPGHEGSSQDIKSRIQKL